MKAIVTDANSTAVLPALLNSSQFAGSWLSAVFPDVWQACLPGGSQAADFERGCHHPADKTPSPGQLAQRALGSQSHAAAQHCDSVAATARSGRCHER